ncbi:MAG: site-specific integrase [Candidatus Omnitrophota bacterium]
MSVNIAAPVQKFFENHLTTERGLSPHTIFSYRDTVKLLLKFAGERHGKSCLNLCVEDLSSDMVRKFLNHLETNRLNAVRTRNARLAAIHSFFRYLASLDPRLMTLSQAILGIPFKRQANPLFEYLEQKEVAEIFSCLDRSKTKDRRDEAVLRILYNTGARAHEIVGLDISHVRFVRPYLVRIHGKGHKERTCPLWPETIGAIKINLQDRDVKVSDRLPLFVNARGQRLTRFGLRHIITQRITRASEKLPTLLNRKIGPHTFRHTTAMHLLQAGVDLNMIRSWLGHSSIETTHTYVELDMDMKQKTLRSCEKLLPKPSKNGPSWKRDPDILTWLEKL